jgi:hypothetical protein
MLAPLQSLLTNHKAILRLENPERGWRISSGLHLLQGAVFVVQLAVLGLMLLALGGGGNASVSGWFLWIGLPLALFVLVFTERAWREEPKFLALLRYSILTATSSAVPAMLGGLAWRFEGISLGVVVLLVSSLAAFVVAWVRLGVLAGLVAQEKDEEG